MFVSWVIWVGSLQSCRIDGALAVYYFLVIRVPFWSNSLVILFPSTAAVLNLWDCGGQDAFYESYFERDRETIFRSVELLIYVFDIESESPEKDFDHFCGVLEAIEENSPDARVFVLVHKMDLVAEEERDAILEDRKRLIAESCTSCGVENFCC